MSVKDISEIRGKVRRILEGMRGTWGIWDLDIKEVVRRDGNFVVTGSFTEGFLSVNWISFTITIDQDGNIIEAKIG